MNRYGVRRLALALHFLCALGSTAIAQQYSAAVECSPLGGKVTFTIYGFAPNTCGWIVDVDVTDQRIDLGVRPYDGPDFCGDTVWPVCVMCATDPLPDGIYQLYLNNPDGGPGEGVPIVVACSAPRTCAPSSIGSPEGANGAVRVVAPLDLDGPGPLPEYLVAAGDFTRIGGVDANRIARWDGAHWHALGEGIGGPDAHVTSVAAHNGSLFAAGQFSKAGDIDASNIARWDGLNWHPLSDGLQSDSWVHAVWALTTFHGDLIAAGSFRFSGNNSVNLIARWDGKNWHPLGSGLDGVIGWGPPPVVTSLVTYREELVAGGIFTTAGAIQVNGIARWNGRSWNALGDDAPIGSAFVVIDQRLAAVSSYWSGFGYCYGSSVSTWNGQKWDSLSIRLEGSQLVTSVVHDTELVAASGGDHGSSCCRNEIVRLRHGQWIREAETSGVFHSLNVFEGNLVAAGSFSEVNGVPANNLVRFSCRCRADFDNSGSIDSQDFFGFLDSFFIGAPAADFNADALINSQDFFDFLGAFFADCS